MGMLDVVRVPEDPVVPYSKRGRRGASRRIKSESVPPPGLGGRDNSVELDSGTTPVGVVFSSTKQIEVKRRVVSTKRDQKERLNADGEASKESFKFQRIFTESDFEASGMMYIPVGQSKPTKASKDNCYVSPFFSNTFLFSLSCGAYHKSSFWLFCFGTELLCLTRSCICYHSSYKFFSRTRRSSPRPTR